MHDMASVHPFPLCFQSKACRQPNSLLSGMRLVAEISTSGSPEENRHIDSLIVSVSWVGERPYFRSDVLINWSANIQISENSPMRPASRV